ncbi:SufE protein probably involved in Fe-S center assembly [Rubrobacter radiotolerans]|uniref:SufE family protein n=1 Tax=Rubrobacter radiotolerans TaxID=42256 RepID=A0A023X2Y0_RUBRA|nr:SufE family protein [Rubrobacter radiotolerans]AHY46424.1 SufE protein probably involved in Fe-S center assembly [Rubrobacter radiotolerans]MDX5893831.1 SufE family protein [Rubrobacter radiotolerans]SMC04585.1 cysteine desulfuration protein SufE [Rubrobacter radiotolerans DSM 5868]
MSTPQRLEEIIAEFSEAPREFKLPMLLEYSKKVPPLPERYAKNPNLLEQVHECQTPFFLAEEIDEAGRVQIHFDAPREAPTTRSFAGVVYEGLNGLTAEEILAVPNDFYTRMGLSEVVSPLRQRGIAGILWRLKKRVRADLEARQAS